MNDLTQSIKTLGRPYSLTRSQLGAVTKVFEQKYICDPVALKDVFDRIKEKLIQLSPSEADFSYLISYSDKTHEEGTAKQLQDMSRIPTGKQTDRIVLKWNAIHHIQEEKNEISITLRVSNPINPLIFLQAALSKSPNDIDNLEFEMGSTCATVSGAGQMYAEEVFHAVQQWIDARNKPHPYFAVHKIYKRYEWLIDQVSKTALPMLLLTMGVSYAYRNFELSLLVATLPILMGAFLIMRDFADKVNYKMATWAQRAKFFSVFQITNGDIDALAKIAAGSRNGCLKLAFSAAISLLLNIAAGIICFYMLKE